MAFENIMETEEQTCNQGLKRRQDHWLWMILLTSLPNDKILDQFELKDLASNKINLNQKLNFTWGRVENIAGKGENAG